MNNRKQKLLLFKLNFQYINKILDGSVIGAAFIKERISSLKKAIERYKRF